MIVGAQILLFFIVEQLIVSSLAAQNSYTNDDDNDYQVISNDNINQGLFIPQPAKNLSFDDSPQTDPLQHSQTMQICPRISEVLLNPGAFPSSSRKYQYIDQVNQVLIVLHNKRLNQGQDRYQLNLYKLVSMDLLFSTQISKEYSFLGYDNLNGLLFIKKLHKSQPLLDLEEQIELKYFQCLQHNQIKGNIKNNNNVDKTNTNANQVFPSECSELLKDLPITQQLSIYSYNHLNDEFKLLSDNQAIPGAFEIRDDEQYIFSCVVDVQNQLLYCNQQSLKDILIISYENNSLQLPQTQEQFIYSLYRYKLSKEKHKNSGDQQPQQIYGGVLIENQSKMIVSSTELLRLTNILEFQRSKECISKRTSFFFEEDAYVCLGSDGQILKVSIKQQTILMKKQMNVFQQTDQTKHFTINIKVVSFRFMLAAVVNSKERTIYDIKSLSNRELKQYQTVIVVSERLVLLSERCNQNDLCLYQQHVDDVIAQSNKLLFMKIENIQHNRMERGYDQEGFQGIHSINGEVSLEGNTKVIYENKVSLIGLVLVHSSGDRSVLDMRRDGVYEIEIIVLEFHEGCQDSEQDCVLVVFRDWMQLSCDQRGVDSISWVDKSRLLIIQTSCYSLLVDLEQHRMHILETKQQLGQINVASKAHSLPFVGFFQRLDPLRSRIHLLLPEQQQQQSGLKQQLDGEKHNLMVMLVGFPVSCMHVLNRKYLLIISAERQVHFCLLNDTQGSQMDNQFGKVVTSPYKLEKQSQEYHSNDPYIKDENQVEDQEIFTKNEEQFIFASSKQFNGIIVVLYLLEQSPLLFFQSQQYHHTSSQSNRQDQLQIIGRFFIVVAAHQEDTTEQATDSDNDSSLPYPPEILITPIEISQDMGECVTRNSKEKQYFYDSLKNVLVFFSKEALCVVAIEQQQQPAQLILKTPMNPSDKVSYDSQTSSVVIVACFKTSALLYTRIYLPKYVERVYANEQRKYEILDASLNENDEELGGSSILIIHMSYLSNGRFVYVERLVERDIRESGENNIKNSETKANTISPVIRIAANQPLAFNLCKTSLGKCQQKRNPSGRNMSGQILSRLFHVRPNDQTNKTGYRLIQIHLSSIDFFDFCIYQSHNATQETVESTGSYRLPYDSKDVFHDLLHFDLVSIEAHSMQLLLVFATRVELQLMTIKDNLSIQMETIMVIAFSQPILLQLHTVLSEFYVTLYAVSNSKIFTYEIPINNRKGDQKEEDINGGRVNMQQLDNCRVEQQRKHISDYNDVHHHLIRSFEAIVFEKSLVFPRQFTYHLNLTDKAISTGMVLPFFGNQQKASLIIYSDQTKVEQTRYINNSTVTSLSQAYSSGYIQLDFQFFSNLKPLQQLHLEHIELSLSNTNTPNGSTHKPTIEISSIRQVLLKDIVLCRDIHHDSIIFSSLRFFNITHLIIHGLKLTHCHVESENSLISFERIQKVTLQDISIEHNSWKSSFDGYHSLNVFSIRNVSELNIHNISFSNNTFIHTQEKYSNLLSSSLNLLSIREVHKADIYLARFANNTHATFLSMSQYIHHSAFGEDAPFRIKEINFYLNLLASNITDNILPAQYFFFVKNGNNNQKEEEESMRDTGILHIHCCWILCSQTGQVELKDVMISGNIAAEQETNNNNNTNPSSDEYSYKSEQTTQGIDTDHNRKRPKNIFSFLSCQSLDLVNVMITSNELFSESSLIVISSVILQYIENLTISQNIYVKPIILLQNSNSLIIRSKIAHNEGSNKPIFVVEQYSNLEIQQTLFIANQCAMCIGSVMFIGNSIAKINECEFTDNTALQGGALSISECSQQIHFQVVTFTGNKAQQGGALALVSCGAVLFNAVVFKKNQAVIAGAIFYANEYPLGFFNQAGLIEFVDNSASFFGQNIGSMPQSLQLQSVDETLVNGQFQLQVHPLTYSVRIEQSQQTIIDASADLNESSKTIYDKQNRRYDQNIYIQNITSGAIIRLAYHIVDEEGNRIYQLSAKDSMSSSTSSNSNSPSIFRIIHNDEDILMINKNAYEIDGCLYIELEILGQPQGPSLSSSFSSPDQQFSLLTIEFSNLQISESLNPIIPELTAFKQNLYLHFRPCRLGEVLVQQQYQSSQGDEKANKIFSGVYKCEECQQGRFSLDPLPDRLSKCISCVSEPAVKQCHSSIVELNSGYWRSSEASRNFLQCDLKENCNGGSQTNPKMACHIGHTGPLCEACDIEGTVWGQKYGESSNHSCTACQTVGQNTLKIIGFIVVTFLLIMLILRSTFKYCQNKIYVKYLRMTGILIMGCSANKKVTSIYVKILMSYVQVWQSVRNLGVEYNEVIFGGLSYVASPLEEVSFSGECFMADLEYSSMPVVYLKLIFALLTPFVLLSIVLLFYYCMCQAKYLSRTRMISYCWTSCFYVILLFQNKIVTMLLGLFSVRYIDGIAYMRANLLYPSTIFSNLLYPALFFWTILVLAVILMVLVKNRKRLHSVRVLLAFGFLYGEYRTDCFYWELLRMSMRTIVAGACNLLSGDVKLSCMVIFLLQWIYLSVLCWKKPFIQRQLNNLEILSTLTSMLTLALALVLVNQRNGMEGDIGKSLSREADGSITVIGCQSVITLANSVFIVFIGYKLVCSLFLRWENGFYKIFGRCLRKRRTNDLKVLKRWSKIRKAIRRRSQMFDSISKCTSRIDKQNSSNCFEVFPDYQGEQNKFARLVNLARRARLEDYQSEQNELTFRGINHHNPRSDSNNYVPPDYSNAWRQHNNEIIGDNCYDKQIKLIQLSALSNRNIEIQQEQNNGNCMKNQEINALDDKNNTKQTEIFDKLTTAVTDTSLLTVTDSFETDINTSINCLISNQQNSSCNKVNYNYEDDDDSFAGIEPTQPPSLSSEQQLAKTQNSHISTAKINPITSVICSI